MTDGWDLGADPGRAGYLLVLGAGWWLLLLGRRRPDDEAEHGPTDGATEEGAGRRRLGRRRPDDEAEPRRRAPGRRATAARSPDDEAAAWVGVGGSRVETSWRLASGDWTTGSTRAKSKALLGWAGLRPRPSKKYTLKKFPTPRAVARLACVPAPPLPALVRGRTSSRPCPGVGDPWIPLC
jgi:hypothetical protein